MILEIATLQIRAGEAMAFEQAFAEAQAIIAASAGYLGHELKRCLDVPDKYVLFVQWQTLEAHTVGFRMSPEFQRWRALLHHFYDPPAVVEHYEAVMFSKT